MMTTAMTHNRIKSVQQAITSVLSKRGHRGAPMENLVAYKMEMIDTWGHDRQMKEWLQGLDVRQYVK